MNKTPDNEIEHPTEWHALIFQEASFAVTHTDLILRTLSKLGVTIPNDEAAPGKLADARRLIEEETRNLLYIHRGASMASWIMEHARMTGSLPGYAGRLSNLKPGSSERLQQQLEASDRAADPGGPRHEAVGVAAPEDSMTLEQMNQAIERKSNRVYFQIGDDLLPIRFMRENPKMIICAAAWKDGQS